MKYTLIHDVYDGTVGLMSSRNNATADNYYHIWIFFKKTEQQRKLCNYGFFPKINRWEINEFRIKITKDFKKIRKNEFKLHFKSLREFSLSALKLNIQI